MDRDNGQQPTRDMSQASVTMLLALLLFAHARADWVEITQLPRKIIRTHMTAPSLERTEPFLFATEPNRIYINHSLDHWSKGVVHRVSNMGNVEKVRLTTEEPGRFKYEETELSDFPQYTKRNPFSTLGDRIPEFVTKEESFEDDDDIEELHFLRSPTGATWTENKNTAKVKADANKSKTPVRRNDIENQTIKENYNNHDQSTKTPIESETLENVLKFVKVVTDTISKNTRRSFSSKLRYLEDLKDTIMVNIEERIESLFPDEARAGVSGTRRRRGARAQARGHVEFPSSEGALMTISFLTFAVYLIKLVLQVIQSYKNKTMMMTPAVIAAVGRAAKQKGN